MRKFKLCVVAAILILSLGLGAVAGRAAAAEQIPSFDANKTLDELTPAEKTAAKAAALHEKLDAFRICADPGNLPYSNTKGGGFYNKIVDVLAKAMDTKPVYFWRPYLDRGLTRETFDNNECDVLLDLPLDYGGVLTTTPIYRTTYVLAYRRDKNLKIESLDDPQLTSLKIGVFQMSGMRDVLAKHGIQNNVEVHVISHDADLVPEHQPLSQIEEVVDGTLDAAAIWGPFAGYAVAKQGAPLTLQPTNLMDDVVPLEFSVALGVRPTDVVLKYMLDNALENSKDEIKAILSDYGVPLVRCSLCIVDGDIPPHGPYALDTQEWAKRRFLQPLPEELTHINREQASPDQVVSTERLENWLKEGADLDQEFSNAVLASDKDRVEFLLSKGADINKPNAQGLAPVHIAARQRDSAMLTFLAERHADIEARDADGWTPLLYAVLRNHVPSIEVLSAHDASLEEAAPGNFTPLALALEEGDFFAAKALIDSRAKVNTASGADHLTPLMVIASQPQAERRSTSLAQGPSSIELAKTLIERGANVNAKTTKGMTALMIAAAHDNVPMIGVLIQAGANVDAKTPEGKTALDIAKDNQNDEAAQQIMLLKLSPRSNSAGGENPAPESGPLLPGQ